MENTLMQGTAKLNLMAYTKDAERFKRLLHRDTIIDANISFLTCEGETISVNVFEFLVLDWETID